MSQFSDKLHSAPFVRLLVPFIAGIVLGDSFPPEQKWFYLGAALFFSLLLPFFIKVSFKKESLFGIFLYPALLFLGIYITTDLKYHPQPLIKGDYFAVIDEFPVEKEKSFRAVIRLTEPKIKVLAYFDKSVPLSNVEPGTVMWFRGQPELLRKTGNPYEFDYQTYAIRNGIGHRIYLKENSIYFLQKEKNPNLLEWSLIIRDRLLKILEKSGMKGEVLHLVSAISLGARDELEPETVQIFSKTGVIHVLAVSGMNVGIIYVVLDLLLRFLKRRRSGIILHTLLILSALWGYALITGMSASVLRAAAMFSFIVIGTNLSRHPNIYNTLAASAFVLLCLNPFLVYNVGFQLSYAAVFSIVFFHPFLYGLLYFKYWIPDQIWILLTVSVAAQIGTIPFLLHYFHQFPTWFLLANLMVIPLVTLILYLTFIVFIVAPIFPFLGEIMARILDWAGQGMLFSVRFVEKLPLSVIDGLYPSDFTLFLVVSFTIFVSLFIIYKNHNFLICSLVTIILLLIFNNFSYYKNLSRKEVVVFNIQGKTLIALTNGMETYWLTTDKSNTAEKLKYYTKPYEGFRKIKKSSIIFLSDTSTINNGNLFCRQSFLNFEGLKFCVLDNRKHNNLDWKHFPQTDIIILSESSLQNQALVRKSLPEAVIIANQTPTEEKMNINLLTAINDLKNLNTSLGGAVQISFGSGKDGEKNILTYGYFNR